MLTMLSVCDVAFGGGKDAKGNFLCIGQPMASRSPIGGGRHGLPEMQSNVEATLQKLLFQKCVVVSRDYWWWVSFSIAAFA